jgi:hypothetical protein
MVWLLTYAALQLLHQRIANNRRKVNIGEDLFYHGELLSYVNLRQQGANIHCRDDVM